MVVVRRDGLAGTVELARAVGRELPQTDGEELHDLACVVLVGELARGGARAHAMHVKVAAKGVAHEDVIVAEPTLGLFVVACGRYDDLRERKGDALAELVLRADCHVIVNHLPVGAPVGDGPVCGEALFALADRADAVPVGELGHTALLAGRATRLETVCIGCKRGCAKIGGHLGRLHLGGKRGEVDHVAQPAEEGEVALLLMPAGDGVVGSVEKVGQTRVCDRVDRIGLHASVSWVADDPI
eukprot:scaffold324392_cov53-Tisochrysis_lutea.AAC.2